MSLCYREQRQLRGIEAGLFRSDSHLAAVRLGWELAISPLARFLPGPHGGFRIRPRGPACAGHAVRPLAQRSGANRPNRLTQPHPGAREG
jgi:hypothetical protein